MRHPASFFGATALLACLLAGCAGPRALKGPTGDGACPKPLRQGIRITTSVAQVAIPDGVRVPSGPVRLVAGVGRRVLIAVDVPQGLPHVRLLSSSLEMLTFGGTLAGWARVVAPGAAIGHQSIHASDGLLRIDPFVPVGKLGSYTETIDLLVVPGGAPAAGLALRPGRMWDDLGRPMEPRDLGIVLSPIQHLKVFDVVSATVRLDWVIRQRSRPHERWQCSTESDFQLVDHRSALPRLWVLQPAEGTGATHPVLALYSPTVGTFPAVFLNPATAAGFARWLRETRARRVGDYEIGLTSQTSATGLQDVSNADFGGLTVQQFGER